MSTDTGTRRGNRDTAAVVIATALFAAGCAGRVGYSATVSSDGYGSDLVYAAPGVQVIADYDEPIFYADNFYWRFSGDRWYRSPQYTGGWAFATPPVAVMRIDRPQAFVHYRPAGWAGHRERVSAQPSGREPRYDRSRPEPRPIQAMPRPTMYQAPPPRAAPQPPPRAAPVPPRAARQAPRERGIGPDRQFRRN
jgi:hypothetical protein